MNVLTGRQLGRATLARQLLLAREKLAILPAVERIGGLQAQLARPPFVALWSRVDGFERAALAASLARKELVRVTHVRSTLHLVSARAFLRQRAALQPMFTAGMQAILKERATALPMKDVLAAAGKALARQPQTFEDLRAFLAGKFPDADERAMGYAVRTHLPLCMVPDGGPWSFPGAAAFALASQYLGAPVDPSGDLEDLLRGYLAAFGPASVADAQRWSGLSGLRPVFARLRPQLAVFRDERKRELFDLPDAPRPAEDAPAPVRFLPDFDSLVLAHDDRSRIIADEHRGKLVLKNLRVLPCFLVDGQVAGTWDAEAKRGTATLTITAFDKLSKPGRKGLEEEGEALLGFLEPEARTRHLVFV